MRGHQISIQRVMIFRMHVQICSRDKELNCNVDVKVIFYGNITIFTVQTVQLVF